jgi:hypothetical protein
MMQGPLMLPVSPAGTAITARADKAFPKPGASARIIPRKQELQYI